MLFTRHITHHEATRFSAAVVGCQCGSAKAERGGSSSIATLRGFGLVARLQHLDWLGPGS